MLISPCQVQVPDLVSMAFCDPFYREKNLPQAKLPSVDFMTLKIGHVFLLKSIIGKEHYIKWFPQIKVSSGKQSHSFLLVNPLDLSNVRVWEELTACLVKFIRVTGEETEAENWSGIRYMWTEG